MAIENGSDFLLKVGDGEAPPTYRTVAGLRTTQLSVNGEAANVTTKDSGGWRELLAVGGRRLILRPSFAALVAAWAGHGDAIAVQTSGGWRFAVPREGTHVMRLADGARLRFEGGTWVEPSTIAPPAGGAVIDSEARGAIAALIAQLAAQGILISG